MNKNYRNSGEGGGVKHFGNTFSTKVSKPTTTLKIRNGLKHTISSTFSL